MKNIKTHFSFLIFVLLLASCGSGTETENDGDQQDSTSESMGETVFEFPEKITFPSEDGLEISAELYERNPNHKIIILCHQARFNKFEYSGVAERICDLGFNCLAIDQRSGGPIGMMQNETNNRAREQGLGVDYEDAIPDIRAAVDWGHENYNGEVILWGSSYSSTLVLWEALRNDKVEAVVSFSPGDYFPNQGSLTDSLANLEKPFFVTAADFEIAGEYGLDALMSKRTLTENQMIFRPDSNGHHGSRALWPNQNGGEQYWEAVTEFLNNIK